MLEDYRGQIFISYLENYNFLVRRNSDRGVPMKHTKRTPQKRGLLRKII
jgi:hypothetical protein